MSNLQTTHTYKGTPYLCASIKEMWPYYQTTDHSKKWWGFTADMSKVVIGGVESEDRLKYIIDASESMNDLIDLLP